MAKRIHKSCLKTKITNLEQEVLEGEFQSATDQIELIASSLTHMLLFAKEENIQKHKDFARMHTRRLENYREHIGRKLALKIGIQNCGYCGKLINQVVELYTDGYCNSSCQDLHSELQHDQMCDE